MSNHRSPIARLRTAIKHLIFPPQRGRDLRDPFLAEALKDDILGTWALDVDSLHYLQDHIEKNRPEYALEFGAGMSSVCLARWMSQVHSDTSTTRVFSIEQNEWQVGKTRAQLDKLGLGKVVSVLHAPVAERTVEGRSATTYGDQSARFPAFFGNARPSLVLVDGPAGDDLTRFATIPDVHEFLAEGATIFLDDKNRPQEQAVAKAWTELPYISSQQGGTKEMAKFQFNNSPVAAR